MSARAPVEIETNAAGTVRIVWDDGHTSEYTGEALRDACSCATCVDEWTGEKRLKREDLPSGVRPVAMQLVGNYAVHIQWSDGHATGIYTWDALRKACLCGACAGKA
jgi:DUF971 family protein